MKRTVEKLDELDLRILALLQREGRISKLELSERVGLSPSACHERVRRLEAARVIRGYHADVDASRVVRVSTVFTEVTLDQHRAEDFARFEQAILQVPEVMECVATGGGIDYLVRFVVRDIDHYQRVVDGLLAADVGIGKYFSYIVTKPVKQTGELPLQHLLGLP